MSQAGSTEHAGWLRRISGGLKAIGPGVAAMLADTDVGSLVIAA